MEDKISLHDIYDKNISFLIGSGASAGLLPTLALEIKDVEGGNSQTIEQLATLFKGEDKKSQKSLLFMHYFKECIEPASHMKLCDLNADDSLLIQEYNKLLMTILTILETKKKQDKICNIFTTNYDGCFTLIADDLLSKGVADFILNDGSYGFQKKFVQAKNFNNLTVNTGVFGRHKTEIPQINLVHLHGSVYWGKDGENITIDYQKKLEIEGLDIDELKEFSEIIQDGDKLVCELDTLTIDKELQEKFWKTYDQLPIVNPTIWKFHETVFEEHYYQMLRYLSYELEKPNSVLIVFGFSFADEHIRNLIKRSLSNQSLQVYICCFSPKSKDTVFEYFKNFRNVNYILPSDGSKLNFKYFNEFVFNSSPIHDNTDNINNDAGA